MLAGNVSGIIRQKQTIQASTKHTRMLDNLVCGSLLYVGGSCDFKRRQSTAMVYRNGSMSNPFLAYDDGFAWPDLYTECDEMLESCVLVYLLAELRSLVRKGEATSKNGHEDAIASQGTNESYQC